MKLNIQGNEAIIEGDDESTAAKFIKGCRGKINVKSPFGNREIKIVKKFKNEK